jgi:hypothetical protein
LLGEGELLKANRRIPAEGGCDKKQCDCFVTAHFSASRCGPKEVTKKF